MESEASVPVTSCHNEWFKAIIKVIMCFFERSLYIICINHIILYAQC